MFRRNQPHINRVNYTYYPLDYGTKQHPDYHFNRRNISGYMANITFDSKVVSPDSSRTFHIVVGEETHHSALRLIHNKGDYYRHHTIIDSAEPPTRAMIEGWAGQNDDGMTTAFGNTEVSSEISAESIAIIINNLRLSVMALGVTMSRLDLERKSINNRRPLRGRFVLPNVPSTSSIRLTDETRPLRLGNHRMVSVTLDAPTKEVAQLLDRN